jgi:hypothetical protein
MWPIHLAFLLFLFQGRNALREDSYVAYKGWIQHGSRTSLLLFAQVLSEDYAHKLYHLVAQCICIYYTKFLHVSAIYLGHFRAATTSVDVYSASGNLSYTTGRVYTCSLLWNLCVLACCTKMYSIRYLLMITR